LAELCVTRASSLAVIGHDRPATEAVALQPLACVIDAVARIPAVAGRTVTVLGLGPIGVLFAHVLKSNDAKQVIGVDVVDRDDIATEWGVDAVVQSTARSHAMRCRESAHLQTDLVIEAIGHQSGTIFDAVDIVAEHGTIYYFGIPDDDYYAFPMESFLRKNGTLMAGYTDEPRRRSALQAAGAYAKEWPGLLSTYVTHVLPVADVSDAFARAATPAPGQLKITLDASEAAVVNPQGIG
jgi:threonine dehydrogenase-like Zn-dependent dehydrogenase